MESVRSGRCCTDTYSQKKQKAAGRGDGMQIHFKSNVHKYWTYALRVRAAGSVDMDSGSVSVSETDKSRMSEALESRADVPWGKRGAHEIRAHHRTTLRTARRIPSYARDETWIRACIAWMQLRLPRGCASASVERRRGEQGTRAAASSERRGDHRMDARRGRTGKKKLQHDGNRVD